MPIALPPVDNRRYQQLVDETLARARVHTPEWTNFSQSDPGVTLVQLFAFLTESLIYRANLVPERNRSKFLQMLGLGLATASAAQGFVAISNDRGPAATLTLPADLELRAGSIVFRSERGLDVLPLETRAYFKRAAAADAPAGIRDYYRLLYASYGKEFPAALNLYETVAFDPAAAGAVDLAETVDRSLWIALLGRSGDRDQASNDPWRHIREELAGRALSLAVAPSLTVNDVRRSPAASPAAAEPLVFEIPRVTADRRLPLVNNVPSPSYRRIEPRASVDLLTTPGIVELVLPTADEIGVWQDLQPLEAGVGDLPPALDDTSLADRVITWLRLRAQPGSNARLLSVAINATWVRQHERIFAEPLADGDGSAGQQRRLARPPVLPGTVSVVTESAGEQRVWQEIDDLMGAGPEVPVTDDRQPPGQPAVATSPTDVFLVDHEAGLLTFGDGFRGRRLPFSARVFASYEFCEGAAGNVAAGAISSAPALPSGLTVTNPLRSWGGADAEPIADGEKQVRRYLQHRDRLVSADDFRTIAWRTPGVDIGRIEVLPAFHPGLAPNEPGSAPGVVTLMAIPRTDPQQPDAPRADRVFLDAICRYLDPRRLVTTELVVSGPIYKLLWVSTGIEVAAGFSVAEVTQGVAQRLRQALSPIGPDAAGMAGSIAPLLSTDAPAAQVGWPLRTSVSARVLLAEVARVPGVLAVDTVLLAEGQLAPAEVIGMSGLELPWLVGVSVVEGEALPIASLRGDAVAVAPSSGGEPVPVMLPVPIVPETC